MLKIYIDRLRDDEIEEIAEEVEPSHFSMDDKDLKFVDMVTIIGRAYMVKSHLILDLKIKAKAEMPCSTCNGKAVMNLQIDDFSHTEDLENIKSAIYDFSDDVRSAILIRIPQFCECQDGECPQRKEVNKYLKSSSDETYTPFAGLE